MRSSNLLAIPTLRVDELKKSRHSSGAAAASVADEESGGVSSSVRLHN